MQSTINLHREIPQEEFADYFENLRDLQEVLKHVENMYHSLRKEITDHEHFDRKAREQEKADRRKLQYLNALIRTEQNVLRKFDESDSYELNVLKRKHNKIMKRRDGRHAARRVVNKIICAQKKATVLAIEDWVAAVGEWFESGILGAGSVGFNGKKFSVS